MILGNTGVLVLRECRVDACEGPCSQTPAAGLRQGAATCVHLMQEHTGYQILE